MAGALSVMVALIQVFAPDLPGGQWIAISGISGRAVSKMGQPNHLSIQVACGGTDEAVGKVGVQSAGSRGWAMVLDGCCRPQPVRRVGTREQRVFTLGADAGTSAAA